MKETEREREREKVDKADVGDVAVDAKGCIPGKGHERRTETLFT